jgi:hypothetical protein
MSSLFATSIRRDANPRDARARFFESGFVDIGEREIASSRG